MKRLGLLSLLLTVMPLAQADITGLWKTVDEETGEAKSIVRIYEQDGYYFGEVDDLLLKPDDTVCEECEGERKGQPIVGMEIISGLEKDGNEYGGGEILDPATGKVYDARLWLEGDDTLKVRGYVGWFFRTQSWQRVE